MLIRFRRVAKPFHVVVSVAVDDADQHISFPPRVILDFMTLLGVPYQPNRILLVILVDFRSSSSRSCWWLFSMVRFLSLVSPFVSHLPTPLCSLRVPPSALNIVPRIN